MFPKKLRAGLAKIVEIYRQKNKQYRLMIILNAYWKLKK